MIIFLYGPDSYRRQQKLNEYVERYKAKFPGVLPAAFDLGEEEGLAKLVDFVRSFSLFSASRLGIVRGIEELEKAGKKEAGKMLKDMCATKEVTLIILADKKPSAELAFLLEAPAISHEFPELKGDGIQEFIKKESAARGIALDVESQYLLMQGCGADAWAIAQELDKLALLGKPAVTKRMTEALTDLSAPINTFALINGLRDGRQRGARLAALEELLEKGGDAAMAFNIIAASQGSSEWKQKMADYDAAIKSGKLEYEEALADLAL